MALPSRNEVAQHGDLTWIERWAFFFRMYLMIVGWVVPYTTNERTHAQTNAPTPRRRLVGSLLKRSVTAVAFVNCSYYCLFPLSFLFHEQGSWCETPRPPTNYPLISSIANKHETPNRCSACLASGRRRRPPRRGT
jgi:hypothetical protein